MIIRFNYMYLMYVYDKTGAMQSQPARHSPWRKAPGEKTARLLCIFLNQSQSSWAALSLGCSDSVTSASRRYNCSALQAHWHLVTLRPTQFNQFVKIFRVISSCVCVCVRVCLFVLHNCWNLHPWLKVCAEYRAHLCWRTFSLRASFHLLWSPVSS